MQRFINSPRFDYHPANHDMKSKLIYMSWALTFVTVMGCVFWPAHAPAQKPAAGTPPAAAYRSYAPSTSREGFPYRGVTIQLQRTDWIEKYKTSINEIAATGADTVSFVIDTRMENGTSSHIWLDVRTTPTPDQLGTLIDHAKSRGLRVMVMPVVLLQSPKNDEWRGTIKPDNWDDWWSSYREMIIHFAWISQGHKVDILCVGSELVSTEDKGREWMRTIEEVRQVFSGKLTYSANWDHYSSIPFWHRLDMIGMNSYWKLGKDHRATVAEMKASWKKIQEDVLDFQQKEGKPLLFTEVGWCSLSNAAHEPWDYTKVSEDLDLDLQKRLYQAFFETWNGNPSLGGFMVWEWPPDSGGPNNKGYIPKGKPAEGILREWMGKPRWQVK